MTIITKIDIDSEKLNIEYKGSTPGPAPAPGPAPEGDTVIMSYYGQWNIYDGKFPIPSYANAKTDIYNALSIWVYGF